jgi:hypothetical protein
LVENPLIKKERNSMELTWLDLARREIVLYCFVFRLGEADGLLRNLHEV